jgi:hypothetical protein
VHIQIAGTDRDDDQIAVGHREGSDVAGDVGVEPEMDQAHAERLELKELAAHAEEDDPPGGQHLFGKSRHGVLVHRQKRRSYLRYGLRDSVMLLRHHLLLGRSFDGIVSLVRLSCIG